MSINLYSGNTTAQIFSNLVPAAVIDANGNWLSVLSGTSTSGVSGPVTTVNNSIATWNGTAGVTLNSTPATIDSSGNISAPNYTLNGFSAAIAPAVATQGSVGTAALPVGNIYNVNQSGINCFVQNLRPTTIQMQGGSASVTATVSGSTSIGSLASPFKSVFSNNLVLIDSNGIEWALRVSISGVITAVSGTY